MPDRRPQPRAHPKSIDSVESLRGPGRDARDSHDETRPAPRPTRARVPRSRCTRARSTASPSSRRRSGAAVSRGAHAQDQHDERQPVRAGPGARARAHASTRLPAESRGVLQPSQRSAALGGAAATPPSPRDSPRGDRTSASPRIRGVIAHSFTSDRAEITHKKGLSLLTPAYAFATLGALPLADLVAAGDHLVRMHRPGYGRRNADRPPLATIAQLSAAVELGRWTGMRTLRRALDLIREDSWSPREWTTRLALVLAGLPEPELNVDIYDSRGCFLGCVDMVYPEHKVIIEYQGAQHSGTYAEDVERFERLRAEGWEVIQVRTRSRHSPRAWSRAWRQRFAPEGGPAGWRRSPRGPDEARTRANDLTVDADLPHRDQHLLTSCSDRRRRGRRTASGRGRDARRRVGPRAARSRSPRR